MPANIFINYRKDDAKWNALSLFKELLKYFPKETIFKDFNTIEPGEDFVVSINKALEQCNVLLVLIGSKWLQIADKNGPRLFNPDDFVRLEIATALERKIRVIPVLFDDTPMPAENQLPDNLKKLSLRQYISVSDTRFEADVKQLAEAIKKVLQQEAVHLVEDTTQLKRGKTALLFGIIGCIVTCIATLFIYSNDQRLREEGTKMLVRVETTGGIISLVLWAVVGAVTGSRRPYIKAGLLSAAIVLVAWIAVGGTYQDVIWSAVAYGTPLAALIGVFIYSLIKRV